MKMKNIIAFTGGMILMLVSSSCNKDYLDKNPLDSIASQTFWNTKEDVAMGLAGCYSRIYGSMMDYQRAYVDALGDATYNYWGFFNTEQQVLGVLSSSSGGMPPAIFNYSYRAIAQCNFFLDNVDKATKVDPGIINVAKGEAKFLRALFYFDLVRSFGGVPLYKTSPATVEVSKIPQSPAADIYAFINEDLDFAIANLPDISYSGGHAVKGSALGIKARVLVTQQRWAEAVTVCQQIMNSGLFSIYGDYEGMFLNRGQKNNPEIMFACEYLTPTLYHSVYGMNIEYAKHIFLMPNLRDNFECIDGLPITESPLYDSSGLGASMRSDETVPWKFRNNRDPRFRYIIRGPNTDWLGHYSYNFYNVTGVQNRKYIDTTIQGTYTYNYLNDWNYILLRYADVLLMYAEAKNEVSGPDATVYAAIDQVRSRPTTLMHPKWKAMPLLDRARNGTKDKVRACIQHERMVEFTDEGERYWDLKRWHIADIVLPKLTNPGGYQYVFTQKFYLWPFQQSELDANPNLVQNDGW
jgi:hypothetical protein